MRGIGTTGPMTIECLVRAFAFYHHNQVASGKRQAARSAATALTAVTRTKIQYWMRVDRGAAEIVTTSAFHMCAHKHSSQLNRNQQNRLTATTNQRRCEWWVFFLFLWILLLALLNASDVTSEPFVLAGTAFWSMRMYAILTSAP